MPRLNKTAIIGHLGTPVELRKTNTNQVSVCNLRVGVNEDYKDKAGTKHERTEWFTVVCYRGLAETCAKVLTTGKQVYVEGRIQTREYMGKATDAEGNPIMYDANTPVMVRKFATEIIANDVQFLGKKDAQNAYAADGSAADVSQPAAGTFVPNPSVSPTDVQDASTVDAAGTFVQPEELQAPEGV